MHTRRGRGIPSRLDKPDVWLMNAHIKSLFMHRRNGLPPVTHGTQGTRKHANAGLRLISAQREKPLRSSDLWGSTVSAFGSHDSAAEPRARRVALNGPRPAVSAARSSITCCQSSVEREGGGHLSCSGLQEPLILKVGQRCEGAAVVGRTRLKRAAARLGQCTTGV